MTDVDGRAYVDAAKEGFYFYDAGDGALHLASKHLAVGLVVPLPHEGAKKADLLMLGLTPGERLYPIRAPGEAEPEPFGMQPNTIWLSTRSVEGMMELAAMSVDVPLEHQQSGVAPVSAPAVYSGVSLPLRIHSDKQQPISVYRIQHRGYWFSIDDTDTESKQLFSTLVDTYTSRIGSRGPRDSSPQIVLPIGGG